MPEVNELLVRDFFESLGFLVTMNLHYETLKSDTRGHSDVDLVVTNPAASAGRPPPFVLRDISDVRRLHAAGVEVKGWHTEALVPSYLTGRDDVTTFVNQKSTAAVQAHLGTNKFRWILAVSRLTKQEKTLAKTIQSLKDAGVDHVITFDTLLDGLIESTDSARPYGHSEYMHLIRLLKIYDKFR